MGNIPPWVKISSVASVGAVITHRLKFGNKTKEDEDPHTDNRPPSEI